MKTVAINARTAPYLKAVYLEADGHDGLTLTWMGEDRMVESHTIDRHPNEPWFKTIDAVEDFLAANELTLAGRPIAKKKRPKMIMVMESWKADAMGCWND